MIKFLPVSVSGSSPAIEWPRIDDDDSPEYIRGLLAGLPRYQAEMALHAYAVRRRTESVGGDPDRVDYWTVSFDDPSLRRMVLQEAGRRRAVALAAKRGRAEMAERAGRDAKRMAAARESASHGAAARSFALSDLLCPLPGESADEGSPEREAARALRAEAEAWVGGGPLTPRVQQWASSQTWSHLVGRYAIT